MQFVKWLLSRGFVQSIATKEVRHLATALAGALASWLLAHSASQSDAANVAEAVSALIVGLGGYGLSLLNQQGQEVRAQVAATTGQVISPSLSKDLVGRGVNAQQMADEAQADKIQLAIAAAESAAPKDKAALIAELLKGGA